jgi:putative transcriptional regulator
MNELDKFLRIRTNNVKPAKGRILLSEPLMGDYFFGRSVVLLAEHNDEGSFGAILNKPVSARFNEVVKDFPEFDAPVYLGGPVDTENLFYIHTKGERLEESTEIMDGLYWGGDIETLKEMMLLKTISPEDIRFFIGYSGWAPDQLEQELQKNSWIIAKVGKEDILNTEATVLWEKLLDKMGEKYRYWKNFPVDPAAN